jgi:mono/diheme cytochrome c family protein
LLDRFGPLTFSDGKPMDVAPRPNLGLQTVTWLHDGEVVHDDDHPPSIQGTILFPGMDGGGEWGGVAYDPRSGLLYVNANEMAWTVRLSGRPMPDEGPTTGKELYQRLCASCHREDFRGTSPELPSLVDIASRRSVDEVVGGRPRRSRAHARQPAAARRRAPRDRAICHDPHVRPRPT